MTFALEETAVWPLQHWELGRKIGVRWHRCLILHGPSGCGKSFLVQQIADQTGSRVVTVRPSDIIKNHVGGSEASLRKAFTDVLNAANSKQAIILYIKALDQVGPSRSRADAHGSRMCTQLLTLLDGASRHPGSKYVTIIGATQRIQDVDPALRRAGRFDKEVSISPPNLEERVAIIERAIAKAQPGSMAVDVHKLAQATGGQSAARVAGQLSTFVVDHIAQRHSCAVGTPPVSANDINIGEPFRGRASPSMPMSFHQPDPDPWGAIAGLEDVKRRLQQAVVWPLRHSSAFSRLGIQAPRGVLLHGPPGCCKTTLIKAAARASGALLQCLAVHDLYSMYLGEGEAHLRSVFRRARQSQPAIILLDELDSLFTKRAAASFQADTASKSESRLLSALLTEIDGVQNSAGVMLIGATNSPNSIDPALLRPGRLDVHISVPLPDLESRLEIFRMHTRNMPLHLDVDLQALARMTQDLSGAQIRNVCHEAAILSMPQTEGSSIPLVQIANEHFEAAIMDVTVPQGTC